MSKAPKSIEDRSNMVRIPYNTEDKNPSSITIDPTIFKLVQAKFENGREWLQSMAKTKRTELLNEAKKKASEHELVKRDSSGNTVAISPDEYIKGKISAAVRDEAIKAITDPSLLAKIEI